MSAQLSGSWQRKAALQDQGSQLREYGQQVISTTATAVEQKVAVAMRDIEGQLLPIVDGFRGVNFDPSHCATYKEGLCEWVDGQLVKELGKVGGASLGAMHDQAQQKLIGECVVIYRTESYFCMVEIFVYFSYFREHHTKLKVRNYSTAIIMFDITILSCTIQNIFKYVVIRKFVFQ